MSAPDERPEQRERPPAGDTYRAGQSVWVWENDGWYPGTIIWTAPLGVLTSYDSPRFGDTTDTVTADRVAPRDDGTPDRGATPSRVRQIDTRPTG